MDDITPDITPAVPVPLAAQAAEARHLRDALAAVQEALDLPFAATIGGEEIRAKLVHERALATMVTVRAILAADRWLDIPREIAFLRGRLERHPVRGYVTDEVAKARRAAGQDYMQSVTPQTDDERPEAGTEVR